MILRALLYCIGVFVLMAVVAIIIAGLIRLMYFFLNNKNGNNGKNKEEVKQVSQ